jgi:hypothetical protein
MAEPTNPSYAAVTTPAGAAGVCAGCGTVANGGSAICAKCGATLPTFGGAPAEQAERMRVRLQEQVGDGYKLLELLGRGGMGIVFRAREVALDRDVALKILTIDPVLAPDAYTRFEREAKLAARLDHPHIVPIFAVGQRQNIAFYTMRLVRGGSLEDLIGAGKQLSLDHVVKLLREVAAALDHAHRQGVVHRDIKPANVLLGETGHAMVADFGIAKALSTNEAGTTGTGIIGSPGYMSPEQWRGDEIDGRADQYSLGIVAYEMLCGKRPFETPRMQDLLRMHLSAEVPPLSYARPGLPEGVDAALRRALAKDPAQRFSSVSAFVDSLAGLRPASMGAMTGRGPRFEKAPPARAQKKSMRGAVFAIVLACAAGAAFAFPQTRDPIMGALLPMLQVVDSMAGVQKVPNGGAPDTLAAHVAAGDATADSAASADSASAAHDSVSHGPVQLAPAPIALDTALSSSMPDTRPVSRMQYGWIKVVINGGTAPAYIDGSRLGSTPQMVRVEAGEHLVTVLGAGDSFLPSQITLTVSANDTTAATFYSPEAMRRAQAAKSARDSAGAKTAAPDSSPSGAVPPRR